MKIVISESQHSRLLNLLNEGPVPAAVARRLNQLKSNIAATKKIVDPLDDIIQSGRNIEIDVNGTSKPLDDGDEVLEAFLGSKLNDADHMIVTKTIFKETDDQTLINAIAKSMVDSNDALRVTYRQDPAAFSNSMESFYGPKQAEALVKILSKTPTPSLSTSLTKALDSVMLKQESINTVRNLISDGALQSRVTQVDDLILALKNGDLSSSDKKTILGALMKHTTEQKQFETFAQELAGLNRAIHKGLFKTDLESAYMGLKTGQTSLYQASLTRIANKLKTELGLSDAQARVYANMVLRPSLGDAFWLGVKAQSGIRPGLKYAAGPILRQFKWWKNFERATPEEKKIFWTWLIGGPSNWPVVFRLMKEWGWLRGIGYGLANVTGQLAKKWIMIWFYISCIDVAGKIWGNMTKEEKELVLSDKKLAQGFWLVIIEELQDIIDPENASFLSPAYKALEFIWRYMNPFYGGNLTRLRGDLDARWGTQLSMVRNQILDDYPDLNFTGSDSTAVGTDSTTVGTDSTTVDTSSGNIENMKKYLDSLNNPIKGDTTSTPKVTIKPGN